MLLSLVMIVRDEEEQLPGCLASAQEAVDEIIIVDTGSSDRSVAIAEGFGAHVLCAQWNNDFAAARNVGLSAAKGRWVLVMDADERFEGDPQRLRRLLAKTTAVGMEVPIRNEIGDGRIDLHSTLRVFRRLPGVRFERRLHEQVLPSLLAVAKGRRIVTAPFSLRHLGYAPDVVERKRKRQRNLELARAEVAANPLDPFAAFNLGVEYTAAGDPEAGILQFRRSREITGHPQPWQSRLYKVEAQNLYRLERFEEALQVISKGLPSFPDYTDLYFLRGITMDAAGDSDGAEAALRHCLRLGPAKSPPYDGVDPLFGGAAAAAALGHLLCRQARYDEALVLLRSATLDAPTFMPAVQALVDCILVAGGGIDELLAERPPDPLAVGAALFRAARYDLALQAFAIAEEQHPDLPADHYLAKAVAFLRLGDTQGAALAVAAAGSEAAESARAYVLDLVGFAEGKIGRSGLKERYAPTHPIWRDIPDDVDAVRA
ncbi:MAG: glycosyltransferase [Thermaerobacter sp.]|nr:glycosyltransferase [Thermaerobacter sp.]